MSAPATSAQPAKPPKVKGRREPETDHGEITRIAAAVAASHAAQRREMIAIAAYFRAQQRSFEPGHELEDWFAAETEIDHPRQVETL
ncbi:MAG: DUF2934 domain-containing protein [Pseudomonadota bacterium]|nr:DUF2934 domain-containing protein [Pseudomonadota bacterium]